MWRRTIFSMALLGATSLSAGAQTVGGDYRVEGRNFDGSRYTGTARIEVTSATTCRIAWETGTSSSGICMLAENLLAAGYVFDSGTVGLVVYRLNSDGSLDGTWTIADTAGAGSETLTPIH